MQCTDRGLVGVRTELKENHKELPNDVPLYNQIPCCNLSIPVKQASQIETNNDKKILPEIEFG